VASADLQVVAAAAAAEEVAEMVSWIVVPAELLKQEHPGGRGWQVAGTGLPLHPEIWDGIPRYF
jgi:hypothetical protein